MSARRPLKTRSRPWARRLALWLSKHGVHPNFISILSVAVSALAALFLVSLPSAGSATRVVMVLLAAGFIQLRLLTNMLDGLVAVEGGQKSRTGDLFNEIPDRIDDTLILVGAGYAVMMYAWGPALGWLAAVLSALTAYIRLLAGSLGLTQPFGGPMAKPHRMAVLTAACLATTIESAIWGFHGWAIAGALALVDVGAMVTCINRTRNIAAQLANR
jgi:phosphatidylglycerophosphate synthase